MGVSAGQAVSRLGAPNSHSLYEGTDTCAQTCPTRHHGGGSNVVDNYLTASGEHQRDSATAPAVVEVLLSVSRRRVGSALEAEGSSELSFLLR